MPTLVSIHCCKVEDLLVELQNRGKTSYRLSRKLGQGEQGDTWSAVQIATGRSVVIRELANQRFSELHRAYVALRKIESAFLPRALDLISGDDHAPAWLVTTWLEGKSLHGARPISWALALVEMRGVAQALASLHALGLHHGDVSANNVIRGSAEGSAITDFGSLGQLGCGTPGYLAPEVLRGGGGMAADVFSWACLLCFRIFGCVPWQTAESIAGLRNFHQVSKRLDELSKSTSLEVPAKLHQVLSLALHPDPRARIADASALLACIEDVLQSHIYWTQSLSRGSQWQLPSNWVYRGQDLRSVAKRLLSSDAAKLVVVAGPPGSGRSRAVQEIIQLCQEESRDGLFVVPSSNPNSENPEQLRSRYIDAWLDSGGQDPAGQQIIGLGVAGTTSTRNDSKTTDPSAAMAALLAFGASVSNRSMVIACELEVVAALDQNLSKNIEIVSLRPWTFKEISEIVESSGINQKVDRWAHALLELTDGWPGRVTEAIAICAAAQISAPDLNIIERAILERSLPIDLLLAEQVLRHSWGDRNTNLPSGYCGQDGWPLAWALAAARRTLALSGSSVVDIAREYLASINVDSDRTVQLLVDAQDVIGIESLVNTALERDVDVDRSLVKWVCDSGFNLVSGSIVAVILRQLIRQGSCDQALQLAQTVRAHPACLIELAKVLQQLGRPQESLDVLADSILDSPQLVFSQAASRWRALCDIGQAQKVLDESILWRDKFLNCRTGAMDESRLDGSLACTWVAYAAWLNGGETDTWIQLASSMLADRSDRRSRGIAARIEQIRGAIAWSAGQQAFALAANRRAYEHYKAAGEDNGRLLIMGNLAAISIPLGEIGSALVWGRKAVRELCTRNMIQPLSAALVNCVQAMLYVRLHEEAEITISVVAKVLRACGAFSGIDGARIDWLTAKVDLERNHESDRVDKLPLIHHLEAAAAQLERSGAFAEATDAWLHAARCYEYKEDRGLANIAWKNARDCSDRVDDQGLQVEILLEALFIGDHGSISQRQALIRLRSHVDLEKWTNGGQLLLIHKYLRTIYSIGHLHRQSLTNPKKIIAQLQLVTESLMNKVSPLDRDSFHESLFGGDSSSETIGELIRDLDQPLAVPEGLGSPRGPQLSGDRESKSHETHWPRLIRIYRRLAREDHLQGVIAQVLEAVLELSGAERGVVIVYDGKGDSIEVARQLSQETDVVAFSRSVVEQVRKSSEPVLSVDAASDQRFDQSQSIHHLRLRSVLAVPLLNKGALIGVIYLDHRLRRGAFDQHDLEMIEDFANLAALALSHIRANEQLRKQAEELDKQRKQLEGLLDKREIEVQSLRETVRHQGPVRTSFHGMIGSSLQMQEVYRKIERLANTHVPVSIYGESGTGKELVACALHQSSDRSSGPFVAENCGAIPETLIESVLFGHARGAFTGADQARPGLFEAANGGTIFLDEIGEMPLPMQTKLLRVLQEGEVRRIGESTNRKLDVRVVAASNRDLQELVKLGRFRQDLYYRICVVKMELPPLRDRSEDIKPLCEHLFSRFGRPDLRIDAAAMRSLMRYAWPGNVRELENEIQRWIALCDHRVELRDLSSSITTKDCRDQDPDDLAIKPRVAALERELIERAFVRTRGNQTQAAGLLGLSRFGLQKKLRRLHGTEDQDAAPNESPGLPSLNDSANLVGTVIRKPPKAKD